MKHAWNEEGPAIGLFPKWAKTASGSILSFSRVNFHGDRNARYILVADVDGPVHVGLLQINPENKGCVVNPEALSETRYLFTGLGDTWDGTLQAPDVIDGFLAGAIGEALPSTLMKEPKVGDLLSNWSISEDWIIQRRGDRVAWTWDLQTQHTVHTGAKDPDGLRGFLTTVIGKDVFVQVGDGLPRGVVTWNLEQGSRALIRWVGDATRGAGMFGTDGKDMVWTYVEGPLGDYKYDKMDVMTAPYTTEASQVQARRLRSDVKAFDPHSWVVGCGYAARPAGLDDPYQNALFIVRLSDGVSWILSGTNEPPKNQWGLPLGITCDEVFTTVSQKPSVRILRIRLDSLGPGTPPD